MRHSLFALLLLACIKVPDLSTVGLDDAGSCEVITIGGSCATAPELERELESRLPCNVCIVYQCECLSHWFCKVCGGDPPIDAAEHPEAWGCTKTEPAFCFDVP